MRVIQASPVQSSPLPALRGAAARAARIERLGLAVTSLVVVMGVALTYQGQTSGFAQVEQDLASGRLVNLSALESGIDFAQLLQPVGASEGGLDPGFPGPAERAAVAAEVARRAKAPGGISHVGALASMTLPAPEVRSDRRLTTLNERLRRRPDAPEVPLFTAADIAALKPQLIVRVPATYERRILAGLLLFVLSFWSAHAVRWWVGSTGDGVLLPAVQLLTGLGFMAMLAMRDPLRDTIAASPFVAGVAGGCLVLVAIGFVDFERAWLRRAALPLLAAAVLLAAALLLFGSGPAGTGARVNLLGAQPVEAIRLLVVFSLAAYFARRWEFLREFSETVGSSRSRARFLRLPRWKDVRPLGITIGTLLIFFFLQKDLGPALVLSCVFLGMYGMSRARAPLVLCGFAALAAGFWAGYLFGMPATVMRRVSIWLDPWSNGLTGGDQIAHALWAFSTGAVLGVGPGAGDPQLIPAGHTDLVLAALGEELGFVGTAAVAGLFALLVWRMLRIALRAPGDYTAFLAAGLCLGIVVQGLIIAGGILGLLPLAGVVTPFLSYGRSAMLSNFAAIAVCCAIARHQGPARVPFVVPVGVLRGTLATAGALVVAWAAVVQVVRADAVATRGHLGLQADGGYRFQYNPRLTAAARQIVRGTIYDRNGVPLATSRPEELEPFAAELRRLGAPVDECRDAAPRCYPLGGLAFHVLGESPRQVNWAARNASFVERELDGRLKGFDDDPKTVVVRAGDAERPGHAVTRDYRELLPLVRHKANPGHEDVRSLLERDRSVRVSLDARLQIAVARALRQHAPAGSRRAAAIVLDAASGQVLASASYPWPEMAPGAPSSEQLLDRARYGLYPPGSTFKVVTAAAAFRAGAGAPRSTFDCGRLPDGRIGGHVHGVGGVIRDDSLDRVPHGRTDLRRALVVSCNVYFANLAQRIGPRALAETAAQAQIATAPSPAAENLPASLAHAGYGQGQVVASPLRMARVAAAIAGGGLLREPRVVLSPSEAEPEPLQWISGETASVLAQYLREAVTSGTGRSLARHPGAIAGKTGTAEVDGARSHAWFVGFAPYRTDGRRIAFAVIVENAGYGARAAAPVAAEIVNAARAAGVIR